MSRFCPRAFFLKALAAEATVSADSMSAVSLLAARLLRNLSDTVVKDIAVTTVINMLRSAAHASIP